MFWANIAFTIMITVNIIIIGVAIKLDINNKEK